MLSYQYVLKKLREGKKTEKWEEVPTSIYQCDLNNSNVHNIIAIDETGTPTLKNVSRNENLRWFAETGIIIEKEHINSFSSDILKIKNKYWKDGMFNNKRVVFHFRDIRKKIGPFNPKVIDYKQFTYDLNELIRYLPFQFSSAVIDKMDHCRQYINPYPVYQLSTQFLFERLTFRMKNVNENCVVMFESRGNREDQELLNNIVSLLKTGNEYGLKFNNILGIYFNKKRTKNHNKSYWPLEIADIVSYYVYEHIKDNKNEMFNKIEDKLIKNGIKVFP